MLPLCHKDMTLGVPGGPVGGWDRDGPPPPSMNLKYKVSGMNDNHQQTTQPAQPVVTPDPPQDVKPPERPKEYGGPKGPEPTRYGDWEKAGRCIDF